MTAPLASTPLVSHQLPGLRVAITGGTSGLGLALVRELLDRGARVAFVARTPDRVEQARLLHDDGVAVADGRILGAVKRP